METMAYKSESGPLYKVRKGRGRERAKREGGGREGDREHE